MSLTNDQCSTNMGNLKNKFIEVLKELDSKGIISFKLPLVNSPNFNVKEFIKIIEDKKIRSDDQCSIFNKKG